MTHKQRSKAISLIRYIAEREIAEKEVTVEINTKLTEFGYFHLSIDINKVNPTDYDILFDYGNTHPHFFFSIGPRGGTKFWNGKVWKNIRGRFIDHITSGLEI